MATTSTRIAYLANGVRDTTGAVVASAKARFYNPGTLVAGVVYQDAACATPYSQPVTCNAGGQATVYTLEPVRMIVKDTTETTTYFDDIVNLVRHDAVYITSPEINGGVETTLENVLTDAGDSLGDGFQYLESATATARNYQDVIRNLAIQAEDYGVVADGSTDDTVTLQAAIARVAALGGHRLLLPPGTIKITAAVTVGTAGVSIEGSGRGISIIKNYSTSGNALNVTLASGDSKLYLKGFSITANTTSSGKAINCSVGNYVVIEDVGVGLHRTGIDVSAITGGDLRHCFVDSTDDNAAAIGLNLGASGKAWNCEVSSATDNGVGIKYASVDARADNCYTTNFATGYSLVSARAVANACNALSATTGFSIGAVANAVVDNCAGSSNTTDLAINAAATLVSLSGNSFSTITASTSTHQPTTNTGALTKVEVTTTPVTCTPDVTAGAMMHLFQTTYAVGPPEFTINAVTGASTLRDGDVIELFFVNAGGNGSSTLTWNAQYMTLNGNGTLSTTGPANALGQLHRFRWDAALSKFRRVAFINTMTH